MFWTPDCVRSLVSSVAGGLLLVVLGATSTSGITSAHGEIVGWGCQVSHSAWSNEAFAEVAGSPSTACVTGNASAHDTSSDDVAALAQKLKDPSEGVRRVAVADLAQLKTPAGWALVVEALADPSPLVADEAQVRLADIGDAASLKSVWGKYGTGSKDPLVVQRVTEAIGRLQIEIDGTPLAKLLAHTDAEVRRTAARALERLAGDNKLSKKSRGFVQQQLERVVEGKKEPALRAAAIPARHALARYTASDLFEMLSKRDAGVVRGSASCTLRDIEFNEIVGLFDDTLEYEDPCTVRILIGLFRSHGRRSAAVSLANILKRYKNLRISWTIVDSLRDWSGLTYGRDPVPWQEWAKALSDDWRAPEQPAAPAERRYPDQPALLGQAVLSEHIAILVDTSEWVLQQRGDGTAQKAWLKAQIGKLLASMPEWSEFNIVPYGRVPAPFSRRLVGLTPDMTRDALKEFEETALPGEDNFLDAAWLALADPCVDTILVITDSAPAGSQHVDPDLIREQFTQRNRFQGVVLDVILVSADADVEAQWRGLSAPSGGRVTKATL